MLTSSLHLEVTLNTSQNFSSLLFGSFAKFRQTSYFSRALKYDKLEGVFQRGNFGSFYTFE